METDGQIAARKDSGTDPEYWAYDEYSSLKWDVCYTYSEGEYNLIVPKGLDYAGMEYVLIVSTHCLECCRFLH